MNKMELADRSHPKKHQLYQTWIDLRCRCDCKTNKDYKHYGGRGITVDPSWYKFWQFVDDMGPKPTKKHSLDRIDNNKGYSKENCRWATKSEQVRNRRPKEKCIRGHKFTPENTKLIDIGRGIVRRCLTCYKEYHKLYDRKDKAGLEQWRKGESNV